MKVGLLYEARKKDVSYKKQCKKVISKMHDQIKKDATLSKLKWTKINKKSCEHVGKMGFAYTNGNGELKNDICERMKAKKAYKVIKQGKIRTMFERL